MIDTLSPLSCCNRLLLDVELPESCYNGNPALHSGEKKNNPWQIKDNQAG